MDQMLGFQMGPLLSLTIMCKMKRGAFPAVLDSSAISYFPRKGAGRPRTLRRMQPQAP